jgi:hypothetical protein
LSSKNAKPLNGIDPVSRALQWQVSEHTFDDALNPLDELQPFAL